MKIGIAIIAGLFCFQQVRSQWSVLQDDPRRTKENYFLYQPFTRAQWDSSSFATPAEMKWFNEARYGMFIHFGLSAYVNKDISWQICYDHKAPDLGHGDYPDSVWQKWPSLFKLEKFDASEWVRTAREAGMKYIVVIAKHHDGFHMWDTQFSDFKITNTPFGRDYLKELADACHKADMPFGIYYSQRDWYHPDYSPVDTTTFKRISDPPYYEALPGKKVIPGPTHKKYIEYQYNVVRELCTKYGKIDIWWWDAAWWNGMFTADMWDSENINRMIRKLQPGIVINNRASIPGDFDTPEQRVGMYQERPWESAITLNGLWAYSPNANKSLKILLRELFSTAQGNGNMLLSWGALWDGHFDETQKKLLLQMGAWLKKYGYAYYGTKGGPWMPDTKWGGATYKGDKIYLYVYDWKDGLLSLPSLSHNEVVHARYINIDAKVSYSEKNDELQFLAPVYPDSIATIIELTMKKPVSGVVKIENESAYNDPAYGSMIKEIPVVADSWKGGQIIIDLKKSVNVTGIGIYENKVNSIISVSVNGEGWKEIGKANNTNTELSLTTYISGAEVLGRTVRYIKLQNTGKAGKVTVKVYAKKEN